MTNIRAIAAKILGELLQENGSLSSHLAAHGQLADFQQLQEICYGSCRWFHALKFFTDRLLEKPLKRKDADVLALLIVGIYQLREMRTPNHAAINETVAAASLLNKTWAKGLVNAVLRNYLRRQAELETALAKQGVAVREAHPQWLVDRLAEHWPADLEALLAGNNLRPPMTLRVNEAQYSRKDYLGLLDSAGIKAVPGAYAGTAVYLEQPVPVAKLPEFNTGAVSVQDEASQLVPQLLTLAAGQRVLDACAAPGGKTCHILESEPSLGQLVAVDRHPDRLKRIHENLNRLQLQAEVELEDSGTPSARCQAEVVLGDASMPSAWWDGTAFDRILVDAPCSATGVVRRHPDIKLLRREESIARHQAEQLAILQALWQCLAPNGLLLYTTCSVLPEENDRVIEIFLREQDDAECAGIEADWGVECRFGRQFLPLAQQGPDGFFYSLLRRQA